MTNLNTQLTKETQSRIERLFGITSIYENNGQLVIESRDAINLSLYLKIRNHHNR